MNTTRFSITPEVLLQQYPIIIWQSYAVEEVAKIAAGCAAGTPQDRILEALKLLAAAEEIAMWTPWDEQESRRKEGNCLGIIPDTERENVLYDLQQQADEIIRLATDAEGRINRVNLCKIACDKAGRKSPKTKDETEDKPLSDDRVKELFRNEWLPLAAEDQARWKLFRQMEQDYHREREELRTAIEKGSSKKVVTQLEDKVATTEAISFQSSGQFYPAAEEIDRRRKAMSEQDRASEREAFLLSLEQGTLGQPKTIRSKEHARNILLGTEDFAGFLEFVRFPKEKPKYVPTLPQVRDGDGAFVKREKGADGKVKPNSDVSHVDEFPVHDLSKNPVESTKTIQWRKKTQR